MSISLLLKMGKTKLIK